MVKKKKKRLNIKRTLFFLLFLYIIGFSIYWIYKRPINHIEISGNNLIKDIDIITAANLKDYPSIFKYSSRTIEKRIKELSLVDSVDVKKTFDFTIKITIKENKVLFYYKNKDKIVLGNGDIINNKLDKLYGIPVFINEADNKVFKEFIKNFNKINENIISEMNTIEYYPDYNNDNEIIDGKNFKIVMNDGNTIITSSDSCNVINKYNEVYASLNGKQGTLYLDKRSNTDSNLIFMPYEG